MKYLFEPDAVVPFLVHSTKFIQQSFMQYISVPDPGLGADGPQRNEPQTLSMERSVSAGERLGQGVVQSSVDFLEEVWLAQA